MFFWIIEERRLHLRNRDFCVLTMGSLYPVLVSGELQLRKYTDKHNAKRTSVEVRAEKINLLDSKAKLEEAQAA